MTDEPKQPFAEGGYVTKLPEGVAVPAVLSPGEHRLPQSVLDRLRDIGSAVIGIDLAGKGGDKTVAVLLHRQSAGQIAEVLHVSPPCIEWTTKPDARVRSIHMAVPAVDFNFVDAFPPADLGRFNCRGEYIHPGGDVMARWLARSDRNTLTQIRLGMTKRAFQRYRGRIKAEMRRRRAIRTRVYYATQKHLRARREAVEEAIVNSIWGGTSEAVARVSPWHCPHGLRINEPCRDCEREHLEAQAEPDLPEGLYLKDGVVMFDCRSCGKATELPVDPHEFDPDSPSNMCGGSPRCCP